MLADNNFDGAKVVSQLIQIGVLAGYDNANVKAIQVPVNGKLVSFESFILMLIYNGLFDSFYDASKVSFSETTRAEYAQKLENILVEKIVNSGVALITDSVNSANKKSIIELLECLEIKVINSTDNVIYFHRGFIAINGSQWSFRCFKGDDLESFINVVINSLSDKQTISVALPSAETMGELVEYIGADDSLKFSSRSMYIIAASIQFLINKKVDVSKLMPTIIAGCSFYEEWQSIDNLIEFIALNQIKALNNNDE